MSEALPAAGSAGADGALPPLSQFNGASTTATPDLRLHHLGIENAKALMYSCAQSLCSASRLLIGR
jgi:hypothetical protein